MMYSMLGFLLCMSPMIALCIYLPLDEYLKKRSMENWMKRPELTDAAFSEVRTLLNSGMYNAERLAVLDNVIGLGFRFSFEQAQEMWSDNRWDWYFDQLDKRIRYKSLRELNIACKVDSIKDKVLEAE